MDLLIENVPEELVRLLEARAARQHRSLEDEILAILAEAVQFLPHPAPPGDWQRDRR